MNIQRFALEPNGPLRLQLSWSAPTKAYEVFLDGQRVGEAPARELAEGSVLKLPDGTTLQLRGYELEDGVEVTHNGKRLSPPTNWPPLVKNATMVLLGMGLLDVMLGLSALSGKAGDAPGWIVGALGGVGGGAGAVGLGAAYLVSSYLASQRVAAAMWAAGALTLLEAALTVGAAVQAGQPFVGAVLLRLVVLAAMVRGLQAVAGLKRGELGA